MEVKILLQPVAKGGWDSWGYVQTLSQLLKKVASSIASQLLTSCSNNQMPSCTQTQWKIRRYIDVIVHSNGNIYRISWSAIMWVLNLKGVNQHSINIPLYPHSIPIQISIHYITINYIYIHIPILSRIFAHDATICWSNPDCNDCVGDYPWISGGFPNRAFSVRKLQGFPRRFSEILQVVWAHRTSALKFLLAYILPVSVVSKKFPNFWYFQ